jgi:hypothetical protein
VGKIRKLTQNSRKKPIISTRIKTEALWQCGISGFFGSRTPGLTGLFFYVFSAFMHFLQHLTPNNYSHRIAAPCP